MEVLTSDLAEAVWTSIGSGGMNSFPERQCMSIVRSQGAKSLIGT